MISEHLKAAHSRRDSQHPTCQGCGCGRQGQSAARAAVGRAQRVSARALQLHKGRAGWNVGMQKWEQEVELQE